MVLAVFAVLLAGCSAPVIQKGVNADYSYQTDGKWVILPIANFSATPQAGNMVERLLEPSLRARGVGELLVYDEVSSGDEDALGLNQMKRQREALKWAAKQKLRYGVSGSVQEWRYKSGVERRPVAALSLKITDVASGRVLWSCSGALSGGGADTISGTAQKLLDTMLADLKMAE